MLTSYPPVTGSPLLRTRSRLFGHVWARLLGRTVCDPQIRDEMLSQGKERKPYQGALQCSTVGFGTQRVEKSDGSNVDLNKEMHGVSLSKRQKKKKTKKRKRKCDRCTGLAAQRAGQYAVGEEPDKAINHIAFE